MCAFRITSALFLRLTLLRWTAEHPRKAKTYNCKKSPTLYALSHSKRRFWILKVLIFCIVTSNLEKMEYSCFHFKKAWHFYIPHPFWHTDLRKTEYSPAIQVNIFWVLCNQLRVDGGQRTGKASNNSRKEKGERLLWKCCSSLAETNLHSALCQCVYFGVCRNQLPDELQSLQRWFHNASWSAVLLDLGKGESVTQQKPNLLLLFSNGDEMNPWEQIPLNYHTIHQTKYSNFSLINETTFKAHPTLDLQDYSVWHLAVRNSILYNPYKWSYKAVLRK